MEKNFKKLKVQAAVLLEKAKLEEEKALKEMGKTALKFLAGEVGVDALRKKAIETGLIEEQK